MILTELLDNLGIDYRTEGGSKHVREGWVGLKCSRCDMGKGNYGLGINLNSFAVSCWSCGKSNLSEVFHEYTGKSWKECHQLVESLRGKRIPINLKQRGSLKFPDGVGPMKLPHKHYLRSRRFDPDTLETLWNVQGIGMSSKLPWRLLIPITFAGKAVSWTTRALSDDTTSKYVSAKPEEEEISPKSLLFGEEYARHSIIVCEGPFDAIRIGPGAVCTMGVQWTNKQAMRISKYPLRAILFDSEPTAQEQAKKLCRFLSLFPGKTVRVEVDAKDPGSLSEKEVSKIRKEFLQ